MKKNKFLIFAFVMAALLLFYFLGPKPSKPVLSNELPTIVQNIDQMDEYVEGLEKGFNIKPNNQARIIWADSSHRKTPFSIVYLHGFSASQMEGDPIHRNLAAKYGCNLYLSRLAEHGLETSEQLLDFTADKLWESAKEAMVIGSKIGDRVILMSTSTGGTVALMLAARFPDRVSALINLSPNIAINDPNAWLLNNPWGLQIARTVVGGKYNIIKYDSINAVYWNDKYRLESLTQLEELLEEDMNATTFHKVKQPCLTLFYYKNDQEQDPVVKVSAMKEMHDQLSTPENQKRLIAVPNAGNHVIGGKLMSKDWQTVQNNIFDFLSSVLKLKAVN